MLELATLGVLLGEPMHGYGLKSWLEHYMGSCVTANYGAIYPLLRRLEQRGLITSEAGSTGRGLTRFTYSITPAGREHWLDGMLELPNESWVNSRLRFMTKFYFFGALDQESRLSLLEQRLCACRARMHSLSGRDDGLDAYQRQVMDHAMQTLASDIGWIELQLVRERTVGSGVEEKINE